VLVVEIKRTVPVQGEGLHECERSSARTLRRWRMRLSRLGGKDHGEGGQPCTNLLSPRLSGKAHRYTIRGRRKKELRQLTAERDTDEG